MQNEFFKAALDGDIPELNRILNEGFDVNSQEDCGITALWYAIFCNNIRTTEFLIMRGADVNAVNYSIAFSKTPLLTAFWEHKLGSSPAMTKLLLDQKADPNAQDRQLETALHKIIPTCTKDFTEDKLTKIKLLLEAKADYTIQNEVGNSPLDLARIHLPSMDLFNLRK